MSKLSKRVLVVVLCSSLVMSGSAMAGWKHHHHHHHHHGYYGHRANNQNNLAAGLLIGGFVGLMAGGALANQSNNSYVNDNDYYSQPSGYRCYRVKVRRERIFNNNGEAFIRTQWKRICD